MEDPENRECTFQPITYNSVRKGEGVDMSHSRMPGSANKWNQLYEQAQFKQAINKQDRNHDDIEFEKNHHEMLFSPEVHAINLRGTKNPIKSNVGKKVGSVLRDRLNEKLNFLNTGQFNTLADQ